jgi:hypothetical protein
LSITYHQIPALGFVSYHKLYAILRPVQIKEMEKAEEEEKKEKEEEEKKKKNKNKKEE